MIRNETIKIISAQTVTISHCNNQACSNVQHMQLQLIHANSQLDVLHHVHVVELRAFLFHLLPVPGNRRIKTNVQLETWNSLTGCDRYGRSLCKRRGVFDDQSSWSNSIRYNIWRQNPFWKVLFRSPLGCWPKHINKQISHRVLPEIAGHETDFKFVSWVPTGNHLRFGQFCDDKWEILSFLKNKT